MNDIAGYVIYHKASEHYQPDYDFWMDSKFCIHVIVPHFILKSIENIKNTIDPLEGSSREHIFDGMPLQDIIQRAACESRLVSEWEDRMDILSEDISWMQFELELDPGCLQVIIPYCVVRGRKLGQMPPPIYPGIEPWLEDE